MYSSVPSLLPLAFGLVAFVAPVTPQASRNCPLLGHVFPPATNLSSDPTITALTKNLSSTVEALVASAPSPINYAADSFSVSMFTGDEQTPFYTTAHSSPLLENATAGVKTVDQNTVYRIGSVTKMLTVYLFLIQAGDQPFNDPITKYIPELLAIETSQNKTGSTLDHVSWSDITVGNLASHMAGIQKEITFGDLSAQGLPVTEFGFPQLNATEIPDCGAAPSPNVKLCDRKTFFQYMSKMRPILASSTTPIYANIPFQLLGYALQSITNKSFADMFDESIVKPLGLTRTSYTQPTTDSFSVISGNASTSLYNLPTGDEDPAGGVYSTATDMTKIGQAILSSKLLPAAVTRRWMKPVTHTASLTLSVGAPWEIQRKVYQGRIIDVYTKEGDLGGYCANIVLLPDFNAGFTVLDAGANPIAVTEQLSDRILGAMIPALDAASKAQAVARFQGTYKSQTENSSVALTSDGGEGLVVSQWISNGTDLLNPTLLKAVNIPATGLRVYPTGLQTQVGSSVTQVGWRAEFQLPPTSTLSVPAADTCPQWDSELQIPFGGVLVNNWVFDLSGGEMMAIEIPALNAKLVRTSSSATPAPPAPPGSSGTPSSPLVSSTPISQTFQGGSGRQVSSSSRLAFVSVVLVSSLMLMLC